MTAPEFRHEGSLVVVTFDGPVSDPELADMLEVLKGVVTDASRRAGFVFDVSRGVVSPASQRQTMAQWLKEHSPTIARNCTAAAYVLPNAALRGLLTALLWVVPHPIPHRVTASAVEAIDWVKGRLRGAGVF